MGGYPEYNFEEAFTTSDSCYFDEYRGMELKLIREKCKVLSDRSNYINVDPKKSVFYGKSGKKIIAQWHDGELFSVDEEGRKKELMYIHICKREMHVETIDSFSSIRKMSIVPGKILFNDETEIEKLFEYSSGGRLYPFLWYVNRLKAQLKRYSLIQILQLNIRRKQIIKLRAKLLASI